MKKLIIFLMFGLALAQCTKEPVTETKVFKTELAFSPGLNTVTGLLKPDHIIFVFFENKGYTSIIGSSSAPYMNSLVARGTLFTNTYALTHPSYPNYVAWFAGTTAGITNDNCINTKTKTDSTMYNMLYNRGITFRWFSENLPSTGSQVCTATGGYVEKHNPTTIFAKTADYINVPFVSSKFTDTAGFKNLPKVVCVTPNMVHDMHDNSISSGDAWLKTHFADLITWSETHNSIVAVYWDESESSNSSNRIPVILIGEHVKAGYQNATRYDHYNFSRTVCSMFGARNSWTNNVASRVDITGCWD